MNWFQAQDYCRENYTDLATVDNDKDMAQMTNLIMMNSIQSVWFGLQTDTGINTWRWSLENQDYYGEGQAAFRMWNVDQPNYDPGLYKSCAAMLLNGHWGADDCESTFPFFCYNKSNEKISSINIYVCVFVCVQYLQYFFLLCSSGREGERARETFFIFSNI